MAATPLGLRKRTVVFFFLLAGVMILLTGRIGWIQFVEGQKLSAKIKEQLLENRTMYSPRGTIYDRNGRELAVSNIAKSLYASPDQIKEPQTLAAELAPILNVSPETLLEKLSGNGSFVWLARRLETEQYNEIDALIKKNNIKGLNFLEESKRYYPNKILLSQVLGFVGTDDEGLEGLEASLNKIIRGSSRQQPINTDNQGVPILESIFSYTLPKEKMSVYLTVDSVIQYIVEKALDKAMSQTSARAGSVIVVNPKTGEVLAMANRPAYDPNFFYKYKQERFRNNSVALVYEPGSTFKAIVAAAALEEGMVNPDSRFYDKGEIQVLDRKIKNWSDKSYGDVSFVEVMKNSINTIFVETGLHLGALKLTDYAQRFGFGQATGIELYGEEDGLLFEPREMRDSDTATMSIGQSIAVTPIQLAAAFSAIANNGLLVKPSIIKEFRSQDGGEAHGGFQTQAVRQVISPETAKTLTEIMEKVVSEGGAARAAVPGYRFAGKTGTAEKITESGYGYQSGRYIASFAGFGPVENPRFAAIIILDDPDGIYYGGQIAAPVFSEIMSQIMLYENVQPQERKQSLESIQKLISGDKETQNPPGDDQPLAPPADGKTQVPDLYGHSIKSAGEILEKQQLKFTPQGTGVAIRQSVRSRETVDVQTEVIVYFEPR